MSVPTEASARSSFRLAACWAMALAAGLLLGVCGCQKQSPPTDATPHPRIVTFSPALTDMVFQMGLGDHVVGVTTQCILPEGVQRQRVGDAFSQNVTEPILAVRPDLLLIQTKIDAFRTLQRLDPKLRVEHFDIENVADIPLAAKRIGELAGRDDLAREHIQKFQDQLDRTAARVAGKARPRVLLVMGYKQPATGGKGTFTGQMIERAGGINAAGELAGWQNLNIEAILSMRPDVIICWLDQEFDKPQEARDYWLALSDLPAAQTGRVYVVTDRYWTIPSLRTAQYIDKLADMLHPPATTTATSGTSGGAP